MKHVHLNLPSIPEVRRTPGNANAKDCFAMCDIPGLLELLGTDNDGHADARNLLRNGDPEMTRAADKFVQQFEDEVFVGETSHMVDDVVGAFPNVQNFIAGVPNTMRHRESTLTDTAPLAIFLELTGSLGTMGESRVKRGAAMLALVRLLSNTRPVELWICTTYGVIGTLNMVAVQVDTTPLDTARAAVLLMSEQVLHATSTVCRKHLASQNANNSGMNWSYGAPAYERGFSAEIVRRVMNPGSRILFIPAAYLRDTLLDDPAQWVRDMLHRYGGEAMGEGEINPEEVHQNKLREEAEKTAEMMRRNNPRGRRRW